MVTRPVVTVLISLCIVEMLLADPAFGADGTAAASVGKATATTTTPAVGASSTPAALPVGSAATPPAPSGFADLYGKAQAVKNPDLLLKTARDDEAALRWESACASYLAAATELCGSGNTFKSKPIVDKVALLGAKLDKTAKRALIDALVAAGESSQARSRFLSSDYMFSAALSLKEQLHESDEQLTKILVKLAAVRGFESQYAAAEVLYRRALTALEATRKEDDPQVLSCLSALATVSSQRGNFAEAAPLLQKLLTLLQKNKVPLGLGHVDYFIQLSQAHRRSGQLDHARAEMDQALEIVNRSLNDANSTIDKDLANDVADALKESVRLILTGRSIDDQTVRVMKTAYKLRLRAEGYDDVSLRDLEDVGNHLIRIGKADQAVELYGKAVKETAEESEPIRAKLQENYIKVLTAANRTADIAAIEAEKQRRLAAIRQEAEQGAERELSEAKKRRDSDSESYVLALMNLARLKLDNRKTQESLSLAREALSTAQKTPEFNNEEFIKSLWSYCTKYAAESSESNKEERFIYEVVNFDEKQRAEHYNYGRCSDTSGVMNYYKDKRRYADAEAFLKHVIAVRKKYRAQDVVALSTAFENLCKFYKFKGDEPRYQEVKSIVLSFLAVRYRNTEPKTILPRLLVVSNRIQDGDLDEAQTILEQVIPTIETHKESSASNQYRTEAINQIRRLTDIFLVNNQVERADPFLRKGAEFYGKGITGSLPDYWLQMSFDKAVDAYCSKDNFTAAAELLKSDIAGRTARSGKDSDEVNRARLRLSEVYLRHSDFAGKKGLQEQSTGLQRSSEAEFNEVAESIAKSNKGVSPMLKLAERRRKTRAFSPLTNDGDYEETPPVYIRRHAKDLTNQSVEAPREPLTFAVFGRSEVVMAGASTSWSCNSDNQPPLILDAAGDVSSYGKLKIRDDARIHGNIIGRTVYMLVRKLGEEAKAIGNVPRPYPLPEPVKPPSTKAVPVAITEGSLSPGPPGFIADLGDFVVNGGKTVKITPGDYLATSFTVSGGAKVEVVKQVVKGQVQPVRIFLRAVPDLRVQLNLDGRSITNGEGAAAQLQYWYPGRGILMLRNGAVLHGVIYAPEALVNISGSNTTVVGSVVADEVRMFGTSRAVYDGALPTAKQMGLPPLSIKPFDKSIPVMDGEDGGTLIMGGDPDYKDAFRAQELLRLRKPGAAVVFLQRAIADDPVAANYGLFARCRLLLKQYPLALESCNKGLALEPNNPVLLATRGQIYQALNQIDKALSDFKRALQLLPCPRNYRDLIAYGVCWMGIGDTAKAEEIFSECIALNPELNDAYEYRAAVYDQQNKPELALQDREKVKRCIEAQLAKANRPPESTRLPK
ncbi:MAG: tetratricopeptide repeat protein [Candidatus Obscuribacterales bacterium]|nr:tetratricopeptide repeat protein [Candidatus Obscuribacterales bacterium]